MLPVQCRRARAAIGLYPERICIAVKGTEGKIQIDLSELVKHGAEKIVEDKIRARLLQTTYAAPAEYLQYLNNILRRRIASEAMELFTEAKACRDIIVHAQGIINERYVEKAGALARAHVGERLPIDLPYFNSVVGTIKDVYASIYDAVISEFGNDEHVSRVLATKGL